MRTDHLNQQSRLRRRLDRGFSLVELLIVIVILGVLATVAVFAVRGITSKGEESSCGADARTLTIAADVYFVQNSTDVLPATGADDDRYERTLVDSGLLKDVSTYYDMAEDGTVSTNGDPCT